MPFETKKLLTIEKPLMRPNRLVLASFRSNGDHFLASTFLQVLLDVFNELCECCQSGNFGLKIGFSTQALKPGRLLSILSTLLDVFFSI